MQSARSPSPTACRDNPSCHRDGSVTRSAEPDSFACDRTRHPTRSTNSRGYAQLDHELSALLAVFYLEHSRFGLFFLNACTMNDGVLTARLTVCPSLLFSRLPQHKKNEIFLDVIERLNILVSNNGTVLRSEILGSLRMKSFLSGMPELKLGLNDKVLMDSSGRADPTKGKSVDLEDIRFHQCVRLSRFENDRTISFIPPDGEFDLMVYRLNTQVRPLIWIEAHVEPHSHSRIEYQIKAKSNFKRRSTANNVEIIIPVPPDADSPSFKTSIGKVEYVPEKNAIVWKIKQFQGQKEVIMRAHFGLPSVSSEDFMGVATNAKAPINVQFEIPYFTGQSGGKRAADAITRIL
jgi:hypothetical protein